MGSRRFRSPLGKRSASTRAPRRSAHLTFGQAMCLDSREGKQSGPVAATLSQRMVAGYAQNSVSDLGAFAVGIVVGLVFVLAVLWRSRGGVRRAWGKMRGFPSEVSASAAERSATKAEGWEKLPWLRLLAIVMGLVAAVGSAVVAIETHDPTVRAVNVVAALVFAVGSALVLVNWSLPRGKGQDAVEDRR